uniref:Putative secreted protein n=1 Tax=Amblyomma triste TaxID=251400 RepID=A0A023G0X3_AMBTT
MRIVMTWLHRLSALCLCSAFVGRTQQRDIRIRRGQVHAATPQRWHTEDIALMSSSCNLAPIAQASSACVEI